jgi:hypothetical protein
MINELRQFYWSLFWLQANITQHNVLSVFIYVDLWLNDVFMLKGLPVRFN